MSGTVATNTLSSIYKNSFGQYLKYSETIGGTIFEQSLNVDNVFKITLDLVENFGKYKQPLNTVVEQYVIEPLLKEINQVIAFETKASDHIFQITLISKSMEIFKWVKERNAEKFISRLHKYIHFYQQKAVLEIEDLGRTHFEWLKFWNETYEEFSIFIVNFFKNGIVWSGNISLPINHTLGDSMIVQKSEDYRALLNDINVGDEIQNILHQTTIPASSSALPKVFAKQDQRWLIQNQKNNHNLVLTSARKEEEIFINNCENCTIVIESLVNVIRLDTCRTVTTLFKNASKVEVAVCEDCNMHCFEKVSNLNLASCDNCCIYLSDKSLDSIIMTTKCSGINVEFPFNDGLYQSFKIADHLKTKISPNKGIETSVA